MDTDNRRPSSRGNHSVTMAKGRGLSSQTPMGNGARLSAAAGYSSTAASLFDPRLQHGLPPTRLGARKFGADDRGMQSQRLNTSATRAKSSSRGSCPPPSPLTSRASSQAESPYLSRPFSQTKSTPRHRRLSGIGTRIGPNAAVSRRPTAPSPGRKLLERPSTTGKSQGEGGIRFCSWNYVSFNNDRPTSVPLSKTPMVDGSASYRSDAPSTSECKSSCTRELAVSVDSKAHLGAVCDQSEQSSTAWKATGGPRQCALEDSIETVKEVADNMSESGVEEVVEESDIGYGMTLGEYMSNMRTTPASTSSVTGLQNDKWEPFRSAVSIEGDSAERRSEEENEMYPVTGHCSDASDHCLPLSEMVAPEAANLRPDTYPFAPSPISQSAHEERETGTGGAYCSAVWNGLDLRPATACQGTSTASFAEVSQTAETKEVDLGSLSAQLFSAFPDNAPTQSESHTDIALASRSQQRPMSANNWARSTTRKPFSRQKSSTQDSNWRGAGLSVEVAEVTSSDIGAQEASLSAGRPHPTRRIHSARPALRADREIESSLRNQVGEARRPPSRQKPPPEALHLFSPQSFVNITIDGTPRRPKSSVALTQRPSRPLSGPSIRQTDEASSGVNTLRPPSRQKPPPESLGLDHAAVRPSKTFRQIFTSDSDEECPGNLSHADIHLSSPEFYVW